MITEKRRARNKAYNAIYYQAHKEKLQADHRTWSAAHLATSGTPRTRNLETERARARAYFARNREKINARARAYYYAHRERLIAYTKAWNAAHPDRVRAAARRYQERKRAAKKNQQDPAGMTAQDPARNGQNRPFRAPCAPGEKGNLTGEQKNRGLKYRWRPKHD